MPITLRGFTANVNVSSGNITVSEPSGTAEGDFLLVEVAHRGTVGYNTPTGWTKIVDESSGNTSTTASTGVGSMEVFTIRRGANAPALTFPVAGTTTVGFARCISYTGVAPTNPIRSTANTTIADACTTVTSSGNITGQRGDMLLIVGAGGSDTLFSGWVQVAGNVSLTETFDSNTTTGSDTTLGQANMILTATTNTSVRYSAVASSRHVIAGIVLAEGMEAGAGSITFTGCAPVALLSDYVTLTPDSGSLSVSGLAPGVVVGVPIVAGFRSFSMMEIGGIGGVAGGANVSITPDTGTVTITGCVPVVSLTQHVSIQPDAGAIEIAGIAPTLSEQWNIAPGSAALTIVGDAPMLVLSIHASPGSGEISIVGDAPTVSQQLLVIPEAGTIEIQGITPIVSQQGDITPDTGVVTIAGHEPTSMVSLSAAPAAGAVSITGEAPVVWMAGQAGFRSFAMFDIGGISGRAPTIITPNSGAVTIEGHAPSASVDLILQPAAGAATITGLAPSVLTPQDVQVPVGAVTIAGSAPEVRLDHFAQPGTCSVTIAGQEPSVTYAGSVSPGFGAITLAGEAPLVLAPFTVQPGAGSLSIAGAAPIVEMAISVTPGAGAITLSGAAPTASSEGKAGFRSFLLLDIGGIGGVYSADIAVTPATGSLSINGLAPDIVRTAHESVTPAAGSITISGFAPTAVATSTIVPAAGSITITGSAPDKFATTINELLLGTSFGRYRLRLAGMEPESPAAIDVGGGALVIAGLAPVVERTDLITSAPDAGSLVLDGLAPTVESSAGMYEYPDPGSVTIAGYPPAVLLASIAQPGSGAVTLSGFEPSVSRQDIQIANPGSGAVQIVGWAPEVTLASIVAPGAGSAVLSGFAPSTSITISVTPGCGEITIAGKAPDRTELLQPVTSLDGVAVGHGNRHEVEYIADRTHRDKTQRTSQPIRSNVVQFTGHAPSVHVTENHVIAPPTGRVNIDGRKVVSLVNYRAMLGLRVKLPVPEVLDADTSVVEPVDHELEEFLMLVASGWS
jgi:hypothetical protein